MKELLLYVRNTPPRKLDDSDKTHKPVMISHHWPFVMRKRLELWKECFID